MERRLFGSLCSKALFNVSVWRKRREMRAGERGGRCERPLSVAVALPESPIRVEQPLASLSLSTEPRAERTADGSLLLLQIVAVLHALELYPCLLHPCHRPPLKTLDRNAFRSLAGLSPSPLRAASRLPNSTRAAYSTIARALQPPHSARMSRSPSSPSPHS
jgi:hypothetical protein